jgi:hypothetical protein
MPVIPTKVESIPTTFPRAFPLVAQSNDLDDNFGCSCKGRGLMDPGVSPRGETVRQAGSVSGPS